MEHSLWSLFLYSNSESGCKADLRLSMKAIFVVNALGQSSRVQKGTPLQCHSLSHQVSTTTDNDSRGMRRKGRRKEELGHFPPRFVY